MRRERTRYFIYGAVFIPVDQALPIHRKIQSLRARFRFHPSDSLKFKTHSRPTQIDIDSHREAKSRLLAIAAETGVVFCAYAVPHAIARNKSKRELTTFGANTLLQRFDRFCEEAGSPGIVMFDRMLPTSDENNYFRTKIGSAWNGRDDQTLRRGQHFVIR